MQENSTENTSSCQSTSESAIPVPIQPPPRHIRHSPRVKKPKIIKDGTLSVLSSSLQNKTNGHTEKASTSSTSTNNKTTNNDSNTPVIPPVRIQTTPPKTLQEKLAATPGFSMKPRRRGNKRKSFNAQLADTKEGAIDLTPDSFLVNINLKSIIDSNTFCRLPTEYQQNLISLLPECDKLNGAESSLRMSSTALNNEFFAKACQEWRERLSEAEFTPENQQRIKQEQEKELLKLDPWKAKHFEAVWGQRKKGDVPKALGPPQSTPKVSSTVQPSQVKQKPLRSMLVSQMLKKRDVSRNVAAKIQATTSSRACVNNSNINNNNSPTSSLSLSMPVTSSLLTSSSATSVTPSDKPLVAKIKLETTTDSTSGPSPIKKIKIIPPTPPQPTQAQAKTLAQIRAQTEAARLQKSGNSVPSVIQSQLAAGPQQVPSGSTKVLNTGAVTASFRLAGQTRTLAQIKAQTQAAKSNVVNVISIPQATGTTQTQVTMRSLLTDPASPGAQSGGQTRTLAQIKARTKQAQIKTVQKPVLPVTVTVSDKSVEAMPRAATPTKNQSVSASPSRVRPLSRNSSADQQKLNLQRSHEICKAEFEKSRNKQESPTSSVKLHSPNNMTLPSESTSSNFTKTPTPTKVVPTTPTKDLPKQQPPQQQQQQILLVTSNNLSQPNTMYLVSAPASTLSNSSTSQVIPVTQVGENVTPSATRIITIPVSKNNETVSSSATTSQGIEQAVRAILARTPPRASSAPPNNVNRQTDVITLVRPASVDIVNNASANNSQSNSSNEEIGLNLNSEQVNFLSKAGTVIQAGRKGSPTKIITRPAVTVVETTQPQSVVPATRNIKGKPTTVDNSVLANGNNKILMETQVANLIRKPVLSNATGIQNVQVLTSGQNIMPVIIQGGTTLPIVSHGNGLTDNSNLLSQSSCACSLKAMVMCEKCGAFCHDDCIGPSKLCVTCLITT
ncbi:hypothetical protein LOTGIDRAFT_157441 [Lottia gigantea]|uniref:DEUBAD domain-containing protein n=1 Tax=Lottia gigantea TaxID=225164 RepID=V4B5I7_LOTGI|nr:hypothetical protein LOTGIDRAFT_157441 [Lottia gigantea]ESP01267.1 hypothetical protein LOTGIDRAFT_157441 [Lottia gigantea]